MTATTRRVPWRRNVNEDQFRGLACVYCAKLLDEATAVRLPTQRYRSLDRYGHWYPRACPGCAS